MKDKKWATNEIDDYMKIEGTRDGLMALEFAKELIDQLDEPDLPVVPDYVAEWIETIRELNGDMVGALIDGNYNMEVGDRLFLDDDTVNVVNSEKLMSAWLNGYTVEEKKYYILLPKINRNWLYVSLRSNYDEFIDHYTDSIEDLQAFTEKEIKAIEPRYFAFAVPVEELEE